MCRKLLLSSVCRELSYSRAGHNWSMARRRNDNIAAKQGYFFDRVVSGARNTQLCKQKAYRLSSCVCTTLYRDKSCLGSIVSWSQIRYHNHTFR